LHRARLGWPSCVIRLSGNQVEVTQGEACRYWAAGRGKLDSRRTGKSDAGTVTSMMSLRPEQQEKLEWLGGGSLAMLLDGKATDGVGTPAEACVAPAVTPWRRPPRQRETGATALAGQDRVTSSMSV